MTLLVLDLHLPGHLTAGSLLWSAMLAEIPSFDDYVISFYMLCVFWIAHLRLMRRLDEVDAAFTWINLTFLLFTTFVPVLTAFAGRNPGLPRPAFLYGANLLAILVCEALMWRHALPRLVNASVSDPVGAWRLVRRKYLMAMVIVARRHVARAGGDRARLHVGLRVVFLPAGDRGRHHAAGSALAARRAARTAAAGAGTGGGQRIPGMTLRRPRIIFCALPPLPMTFIIFCVCSNCFSS